MFIFHSRSKEGQLVRVQHGTGARHEQTDTL